LVDLDDFRKGDPMVPAVQDVDGLALNPACAAVHHGQAGGGVIRLDLLERAIDDALRDLLHAVREE